MPQIFKYLGHWKLEKAQTQEPWLSCSVARQRWDGAGLKLAYRTSARQPRCPLMALRLCLSLSFSPCF